MKKEKLRERRSPNMLNFKDFFKKQKTKRGWEQEDNQGFKSEPKDKPNSAASLQAAHKSPASKLNTGNTM